MKKRNIKKYFLTDEGIQIFEKIEKSEKSYTQLAQEMGLVSPTIYKILKSTPFSVRTLNKIQAYFTGFTEGVHYDIM